ncbi:hypothetical protein AV530_002200 [Patagioenas fasciata monilis]|uniref:Uncharacterized protein n=1 Tax=Patagioenas fasciata monilis TaxID=372326 RepID=A0A1V4K5H5_PATFA|nr:hypothetical protein AV530_002200 [Patagioenas fasciata monilis]
MTFSCPEQYRTMPSSELDPETKPEGSRGRGATLKPGIMRVSTRCRALLQAGTGQRVIHAAREMSHIFGMEFPREEERRNTSAHPPVTPNFVHWS